MKGVVPSEGVSNLLMRFWHHLAQRRRHQVVLLLGLMIFSGFAEMVSLGAVLPFLGILAVPDQVFSHPVVASIAQEFAVTSADQLVLPLTIAFVLAAFLAGAARLLLLWVKTRLSYAIGLDISTEIYQRTLYQPYRMHVMRNSSEVISAVTHKVGHTTHVLNMLMTLISSILMVVFVTFTLIVINPFISITVILGFGTSYVLIAWLARKRLEKYQPTSRVWVYKNSTALAGGFGKYSRHTIGWTTAEHIVTAIVKKTYRCSERRAITRLFLGAHTFSWKHSG